MIKTWKNRSTKRKQHKIPTHFAIIGCWKRCDPRAKSKFPCDTHRVFRRRTDFPCSLTCGDGESPSASLNADRLLFDSRAVISRLTDFLFHLWREKKSWFLRIVLHLSTTARLAIIVAGKKGKILYTNEEKRKHLFAQLIRDFYLIVFVVFVLCPHTFSFSMRSRFFFTEWKAAFLCLFVLSTKVRLFYSGSLTTISVFDDASCERIFSSCAGIYLECEQKIHCFRDLSRFQLWFLECSLTKNKRSWSLSVINHSIKIKLITRGDKIFMQFSMMKLQLWNVIRIFGKTWNFSKE